ncbi:hypothetical protein OG21DRAFT_1013169 [Imleria badia]|nr:hypothetical protein OG21DRAFT_1013169 [Imleria badia]
MIGDRLYRSSSIFTTLAAAHSAPRSTDRIKGRKDSRTLLFFKFILSQPSHESQTLPWLLHPVQFVSHWRPHAINDVSRNVLRLSDFIKEVSVFIEFMLSQPSHGHYFPGASL